MVTAVSVVTSAIIAGDVAITGGALHQVVEGAVRETHRPDVPDHNRSHPYQIPAKVSVTITTVRRSSAFPRSDGWW
jgi:hypothetical protein